MGFKLKGYRGQGKASSHMAIEGSDAANQMKEGTYMHHPAPKMSKPANMSHVPGHNPRAEQKAKAAGYDSFDEYFKATYPNVGKPRAEMPEVKEQEVSRAYAFAGPKPKYDADAVKENRLQRTKEFNLTPEGRAMADEISKYSIHMKKPLTSGPNKGKYLTKDADGNTEYFTAEKYKEAADKYHQGLVDYATPKNQEMKAIHGNVGTFTDYPTSPQYGEAYSKLMKIGYYAEDK